MAVRLYLRFDTDANLEKYLGIKPGSCLDWENLNLDNDPDFCYHCQQLQEKEGEVDISYEKYIWLKEEYPDLDKLEMFRIYGHGRISPGVHDLIDDTGLDTNAGRVTAEIDMRTILFRQGLISDIQSPLPEGITSVYWG